MSFLTHILILNNDLVKMHYHQKKSFMILLIDYADLYLKSDVLLLMDIFIYSRSTCFHTFNLYPTQYIISSSLSWKSMLRKTEVKLELVIVIGMLHFFRNNIRSAVSQRSKQIEKRIINIFLISILPKPYLIVLVSINWYGKNMREGLSSRWF